MSFKGGRRHGNVDRGALRGVEDMVADTIQNCACRRTAKIETGPRSVL
jgi:hypothetical protein